MGRMYTTQSRREIARRRAAEALERVVRRLGKERAAIAPELERVRRLAAQLRAGGANVADTSSARVVRALAESGLFDAGAVLVGTHAFGVLGKCAGSPLGLRSAAQRRTTTLIRSTRRPRSRYAARHEVKRAVLAP